MGNQPSTPLRKERSSMDSGLTAEPPSNNETLTENRSAMSHLLSRKQLSKFKLPNFVSRASSLRHSNNAPKLEPEALQKALDGRADDETAPTEEASQIKTLAPTSTDVAPYSPLLWKAPSPTEMNNVTRGVQRSVTPTATSQASLFSAPGRPSSSSDRTITGQRVLSDSSTFRRHLQFPIQPKGPVKAAPLIPEHFKCYQSHSCMVISPNALHPVPCMVCQREDKAQRWKCAWCCLRVCRGCMDDLSRIKGRRLETLVANIRNAREGFVSPQTEGAIGDGKATEKVHIDPDAKGMS